MARFNPLGIIVIVVVIVVLATALKDNYLQIAELPSGLGDDLYAVLPGLFVTLFGFVLVGVSGFNGPVVVGGFGGVGFGLAVLWGEMYAASIIDSTLLAGATLVQVQAITIIVSLLMGFVAYASHK